jgi:PTH1 family peptidyl-tRNA hydrolase
LRIGIGHPGNSRDVSDFVLKRAPKSEQILIDEAIESALDVFPLILEGQLEKAMHQLHTNN